ncbi:protein SCO12, mitochondrial [Sesamum alatum]|uniref:Protein SCO12, mitochondrial n=1 Tax=Sesamum alatum TaxID=300844 RepID=A0AAE1XTD7_9LAMI|nr:protein SCO12, mitochondrial [Sesamum alatum]
MPLSSRIVCSSLKNSESSLQILRRFVASRRFSSSIFTRCAQSNVSRYPLTEPTLVRDPEGLNCFMRFGSSKRYYSSSTRSTSSNKPSLPLPEQAVTHVSWRSYLIPGSVLAGIGGLVFFIHYNDEKRAVPKGKGEKFERSAIQGPIIGGPFSLIDTEGQLVTEKNLLGNWVLLYFGYTSSPDVGPAEVRKMANAINILESKENTKVLPVFVTIDPQRDTPSQLRAYIREFDSRILGLTGPVAAIRQMAQEYRVYFKKVDEEGDDYLVESSHNMYLMNPNMEVARSFGVEYSAEELAEAITKEMNKTKTTISSS